MNLRRRIRQLEERAGDHPPDPAEVLAAIQRSQERAKAKLRAWPDVPPSLGSDEEQVARDEETLARVRGARAPYAGLARRKLSAMRRSED